MTIIITVLSFLALILCGYLLLNKGGQHAQDEESPAPAAPLRSTMPGVGYLGKVRDLRPRLTPILTPVIQPSYGTVLVSEAAEEWADGPTDPDALTLDERLRREEVARVQRLDREWFDAPPPAAARRTAETLALQQKWGR